MKRTRPLRLSSCALVLLLAVGASSRGVPSLRDQVSLAGVWEHGGGVANNQGDRFDRNTDQRRVAARADWAGKHIELESRLGNYTASVYRDNQPVRVTGDVAQVDSSETVKLGNLRPCSFPDSPLTTVIPQEIDDPLVNPYCGWGIWAGTRFFDSRPFSIDYNTQGFGDDAPLFSWVLIDWMWSDLEPKEGLFQWDDLDKVVDYWKARNKQLVVRLWVTTDPGWAGAAGNKACPDWLWDVGVKYHSYKGEGGVAQRCPAYADPTWETHYLPRLERFLTAYRDRYHTPGNPIMLDHVMGFGDWGEWHSMWSHYPWPSRETKREVLGKAIEAYLEVFAPNQPAHEPVRNLAIAHVYDDDCGGEVPLDEALRRQALDIALGKGFALTRNGFIDGLGGWPNDLMDKYWQDHQLIAEANWSYEQVKKDKTHGTMAEHVDAFSRWHSAYAHLYMHADSYKQAMAEDRGEFERALRAGGIGYRFVLTSASWETTRQPGQTLTLRQEWVNRNSSWCVQPYRLKLYLEEKDGTPVWAGTDAAFDPRPWVRGNSYTVDSRFPLPEDLKPGTYVLRVAMVDASGAPRVRLAIAGADAELRYRLGEVEITPFEPKQPALPANTGQTSSQEHRFALTTRGKEIILDARAPGRTFDGIGETCAGGGVGRLLINYPEPQRSEVLDYLFKPNYGASLHVLKVEIGGDGNSTEGSEPSHMHTRDDLSFQRGYTWWLMKEAKKRNPDIQIHALAWDWPGWIKEIHSDDAVNYLVGYIQGAKREHGITIDFIGGWNETPFNYSFFKKLRKVLDGAGLKTKIAAADQVQHWDIVERAANDPELLAAIDVFGSHYVRYQSTPQARSTGKPLWSQEDGPWNDNWAADGAMGGAYPKILNRNYIEGRITSTQLWCLISAYYDILDVPNAGLMRALTPWSGHYEVRTPLWMVAHTTQFAYPGWRYLDSACTLLEKGGSIVALAHDGDFSVIVETLDASEPQSLKFTIVNELKDGPIHLWRTDDRETFVHAESIEPVNRAFPLTLQPRTLYSLTTTTGQAKGMAQPPPDAPFPMPYHDPFDDGTIGTTTGRYYIEQNGSYEFVAAPERDGRCLRQVVSQTPLVWPFGPEANTMGTLCIIGDKQWANYEVEIDTRLEEPGYARVAGRIARAQLNGTVSGYQLYVWDTGEWRLVTRTWTDGKTGVLAEGRATIGLNQWHSLKLRFHGRDVSAYLDGRELATVQDDHFHRGMAGFGNGWNRGCYDNLRITPIANTELMARTDRTSAALPIAPNLKAAVPQSQAVQLEWDAVPGAEGYKVLYGTAPDKLTSVVDAGVATNYRCWTLSNGTTYHFAVAAYNFNGDGPPSKSLPATPRDKARK